MGARWKRFPQVLSLAGSLVLGCTQATDDPTVMQAASSLGAHSIVITGVVDLGTFSVPNEWGSMGSRTFELYGSFPTTTGLTYRPHVFCDGRQMPSQILTGWSATQVNVSIPNLPMYQATSCWFLLELSDASRLSSATSYSNQFGPVAPTLRDPLVS